LHMPKRRLWPQILVSLALTGLATGVVLRLTWQERSWRELQSFDTRWLLVALGLVLGAWVADVWRLQAMGLGMGYRIPFRVALRTNLLGYFLSAITPFTVGGGRCHDLRPRLPGRPCPSATPRPRSWAAASSPT